MANFIQAQSSNGYVIHAVRENYPYAGHPVWRTRHVLWGPGLCGVKGKDAWGLPTLFPVGISPENETPLPFTADLLNLITESYDGKLMNSVCPSCLAKVKKEN